MSVPTSAKQIRAYLAARPHLIPVGFEDSVRPDKHGRLPQTVKDAFRTATRSKRVHAEHVPTGPRVRVGNRQVLVADIRAALMTAGVPVADRAPLSKAQIAAFKAL